MINHEEILLNNPIITKITHKKSKRLFVRHKEFEWANHLLKRPSTQFFTIKYYSVDKYHNFW
ncbi:MAG: hypothetical protein ACREAG_03300 [Nitrosopumilaceae archaeon]